MELRITTLIENQPGSRADLASEHGLSLYLEYGGKRLLFDTGQTGAFADNAEKLGISLHDLDAVILSHGHYDHSGGLPRLLPLLRPGTPIFIGAGFFTPKYKTVPEGYLHNGNPFPGDLLRPYPVRLTEVSEPVTEPAPGILLFRSFPRNCPFEQPNPRFFLGDAEGFRPDLFLDELALGLVTGRGLVVLSGCAHPGIVTMLRAIAGRAPQKLFAVIGGTHLVEAGEERILDTIAAFRELELCQIAVSHCTGARGCAMLQEAFPDAFTENHTGSILTF